MIHWINKNKKKMDQNFETYTKETINLIPEKKTCKMRLRINESPKKLSDKILEQKQTIIFQPHKIN